MWILNLTLVPSSGRMKRQCQTKIHTAAESNPKAASVFTWLDCHFFVIKFACLLFVGAQIVGVNCHFDPETCVKTVKMMKAGVEKAGLKAHYMTQPLAFHTPDCNCQGFIDLPEFPFSMYKNLKRMQCLNLNRDMEDNVQPVFSLTGLEPRILTRWDMQKYAREAYNAGIHYIGGCCGFEPYHTRALAEELAPERGFLPAGSEKHGNWGSGLEMHTKPWVRARYCR